MQRKVKHKIQQSGSRKHPENENRSAFKVLILNHGGIYYLNDQD